MGTPSSDPRWAGLKLRHIALVLLVVQTVSTILALRISRTPIIDQDTGIAKPLYINSTAVAVCELVKLIVSLFLLWLETRKQNQSLVSVIKAGVLENRADNIRMCIPSLLYTFQNNFLFIALSNMSGALYQVTYQLKILSTAVLSVIILNKYLSSDKWAALFILTAGVGLIQLPVGNTGKLTTNGGNLFIGVVAVLLACLTSGFAGVYLEKCLKASGSIWWRNVQLAFYGLVLALIGAYANDGPAIIRNGFFQNYNTSTWVAVLLQSAGGIIVAMVLKYADNILKCFGNACAIALSCLCSYWLGDFTPSILFVVGTMLVIFATYSYSTDVLSPAKLVLWFNTNIGIPKEMTKMRAYSPSSNHDGSPQVSKPYLSDQEQNV